MNKIAFVGSNPSRVGAKSPAIKTLTEWRDRMNVHDAAFFNVSNIVTPNNRPLKKSEFELTRLKRDLTPYSKIVALGRTASEALRMVDLPHFKLPHPSPKNRVLNDRNYVELLLNECKTYLRDYKYSSELDII